MTESTTATRVKQNKSPITAFIDDERREKLLRIARRKELKLSDVVRQAIKEYTDKYDE